MSIVLNVNQLEKMTTTLKGYACGGQLQDISLSQNYLLLQHQLKGPITIGIELRPLTPSLGYFFGEIPKSKYLIKPIVLFLRAHARNLRLSDIYVEKELGRVVRLKYIGTENRECHLEIRLIPHGVNIIVKSQEKSLSLFVVKDLPLSKTSSEMFESEFDENQYLDQWMNSFLGRSTNNKSGISIIDEQQKKFKKEINKKEILIEKLTQDLNSMNKPWFQVGEYLKLNQTLDVPDEWLKYIDHHLPININMQQCYDKYKKQEQRIVQIKERIHHLKSEVLQHHKEMEGLSSSSQLNQSPNSDFSSSTSVRSLAGELLSKAKAKGRKLKLADDIEAVFGKSAKDNLAILRRAQPWDIWLHLKDLPGAHLIIRRPKSKSVDQHFLLNAAKWLLSETIGKKKVIEGDRYDIIVTECRYVKPIRGDRLGRVTYQNESTLTLRV